MSASRFAVLCAALAALVACDKNTGPTYADKVPLAAVRFVHAVSDTGAMDWRFVDVIENSPVGLGMKYRDVYPGTSYQALGAGARHLRLFQTSNDIAQTQVVLFDTTYNFTPGEHYTIMAAGTLRNKQAKLYILQDDYSDPGSNIAVRVINAGAAASVDAYGSSTGGTSPLPASPFVSGVAQFTASKWVTMAPAALVVRVLASGSTALPAMIDATAPAGAPADRANNLTAVGGSTIAGSAFTAFAFPPSVAGSQAASSTKPSVVYAVDRYPPSGF
ncbi:MAG TPA: DUF4397 domain-containing protein [Gemmatimonadaceae bacterium]|nr:DUF4397 domain-containing protein [Gemmatimonadaceae bacterium]